MSFRFPVAVIVCMTACAGTGPSMTFGPTRTPLRYTMTDESDLSIETPGGSMG